MSHMAIISKRKRGGGRGRLLGSRRLQTPAVTPSMNPRYAAAKSPTAFQQLLGRGPYMERMKKERRKISKRYKQTLQQQRKRDLREEREFKKEIDYLRKNDKLGAGFFKFDKRKRSYLKDLEEHRKQLERHYRLGKKAKDLSPRERELRQQRFDRAFRKRELNTIRHNRLANKAGEKVIQKQRDKEMKEMSKTLREQTVTKPGGLGSVVMGAPQGQGGPEDPGQKAT